MLLILSLLIAIVCAVVCHQLARRRDRNPVLWGVLGALFGPFAIPFILFARTSSDRNTGS